MKKLAIVIPVFNKVNFTKSCLEDLSKLSEEDHDIIVVDNDSSDNTAEVCLSYPKKNIIYIHNDSNLGFGKACNIGYDAANTTNVMFLNNDIKVRSNHSNWTDDIINLCHLGFVGPTMGYLDNNFEFIMESNTLKSYKNFYMSGWCLASSKANFDKLAIPRESDSVIKNKQIFCEDFFAYFEDTDLSFRARKIDYLQFNLVNIPVVHFGKQTSSQLNTYKLYKDSKTIFLKKWEK